MKLQNLYFKQMIIDIITSLIDNVSYLIRNSSHFIRSLRIRSLSAHCLVHLHLYVAHLLYVAGVFENDKLRCQKKNCDNK